MHKWYATAYKICSYIFRFVNLISQLLIVFECKTFPHTLRFATVKHADEAEINSLSSESLTLYVNICSCSPKSIFSMLPTHLKGAREKPDRRLKCTYLLLEELKMCSEVRCQLSLWQQNNSFCTEHILKMSLFGDINLGCNPLNCWGPRKSFHGFQRD